MGTKALVLEAEKESKRVVQVGTQQRSMPHLIAAREIVRSGRLGEILEVHMTSSRNVARARANATNIDPATDRLPVLSPSTPQLTAAPHPPQPPPPFDPYQFPNSRWFWKYGGGIFTDLMVHWLDTVVWMMDLQPPASAAAIGGTYHAQGLWHTPDNARGGAMTEIMGSEARLYFDRGRCELIPERNKQIKAEEMILGTGPRGADFYDKPDAARQRPACTAADGVRSAAGAHLANMALLRNNGCS